MKNYSYPRVVTSVTALPRSSARPAAEDTTVLFVPIISKTGPVGELVKVHSLEEFRSTFGLDERLGLTLLNISNWLTAGGTVYAYRVAKKDREVEGSVIPGAKKTEWQADAVSGTVRPFCAKSKYVGSLLNSYSVKAILQKGGILLVQVINNGVIVENIRLKTKDIISQEEFDISNVSEYLSSVTVTFKSANEKGEFAVASNDDNENHKIMVIIDGNPNGRIIDGTDGWSDLEEALEYFWTPDSDNDDLVNAIGNRLETPIDLIMDAGYSYEIKRLMIQAISHRDEVNGIDALRSDINGFFDIYALDSDGKPTNIDEEEHLIDDLASIKESLFGDDDPYKETSNVFFYHQYFVISEEAYFNKDMVVFPSYFLSKLIPANDVANGIQYPVAGKRRGELEGVKKISVNPDPDQKDAWFLDRINYVEKDSRGYYFMSQRTFDGSTEELYNALSFINNARVTVRMVHDLERLGRDYLFEFNDSITLANMSAVLNRYVTNWISNRTLSFGNVVVSADPYSDERVNAVLNIKFVGTIEVISIDLILE